MPQVFIPNKGLHDLSKASRFGKLVVLTEGVLKQYKVHEMARVCELGMRDSGPNDFILISGIPVIVGVCSAVFAAKHNRVNYLMWNGRDYEVREILMGAASGTEDGSRRVHEPLDGRQ